MEVQTSADNFAQNFKQILKDHAGEMQKCIENCVQCHTICEQTIMHCLKMGNKHSDPKHIGILKDCSQICSVSADFMLRGSTLHHRTCGVCAQACRTCAEDCDRLAGNDEMMKLCAELCRRCAESCQSMAAEH